MLFIQRMWIIVFVVVFRYWVLLKHGVTVLLEGLRYATPADLEKADLIP